MDRFEDDEIDFSQLILSLVKVFGRNKILILTFIIVGPIAGTVYYYTTTKIYESSMMLRSDILNEAYSNNLIDNLKKLVDQRNEEVLSQKLNLSTAETIQIKDIKVKNVESSSSDKITQNVIFLISVKITDNDILPKLQKGIIKYLEDNEYVKKRVELKKERYANLIKKTRLDIQEMDSLKENFLSGTVFNQKSGSNVVFFDPTEVYTKVMSLYKEEITYMQELELIDSIQVIEGFTNFNKPIAPRRLRSIAIGLVIGFIIAFLSVLLHETGSYLRRLDK